MSQASPTTDLMPGEKEKPFRTEPPADAADCTPDEKPETVLSLTISGEWAHFGRIDGTVVKQTYKIMPRTTVAGLLAAIIGYDRNTYYEVFAEGVSDIAITPQPAGGEFTKMNLPQNMLSTSNSKQASWDNKDMHDVTDGTQSAHINYVDPAAPRQRINVETLRNIGYRIDVRVADTYTYQTLRERLENGETAYPVSLGLSEYLASIEYHGEFEATNLPDGEHQVSSTVPDAHGAIDTEAVTPIHHEQSAGMMTMDNDHGELPRRRNTKFITHSYTTPVDNGLVVESGDVYEVGDRKVMFS